jgi:hypothetical protein
MLKSDIIITTKDISDGYKSGQNIYFLCSYVLAGPGKTIIPMYMYSEGKVYYKALYLYSFNITEEKLTRIAELNSLASDPGKPDLQITRWAAGDSMIYMLYHSGWDKSAKEIKWNFFRYNLKNNAVDEVKGDDKSKLMKLLFPKEKIHPHSKENVIISSGVWYYPGILPEQSGGLPSPTYYSKKNEKQFIKSIVEMKNDRFFREAAYNCLKKSFPPDQLMDIISSMNKRYDKLVSIEKMQYRPYMEEWSSRIYIDARFLRKSSDRESMTFEESIFRNDPDKVKELMAKNPDINKPDSYGLTPLMIASYTNNHWVAGELIKKGADINAQDKNGCTPLMYAVFCRAHRTMELLIKKGADLKKESRSGWIAWMFVSDTRLRERYIEAAGLNKTK